MVTCHVGIDVHVYMCTHFFTWTVYTDQMELLARSSCSVPSSPSSCSKMNAFINNQALTFSKNLWQVIPLPLEQSFPKTPGLHRHRYPLFWFTQVPPYLQGFTLQLLRAASRHNQIHIRKHLQWAIFSILIRYQTVGSTVLQKKKKKKKEHNCTCFKNKLRYYVSCYHPELFGWQFSGKKVLLLDWECI